MSRGIVGLFETWKKGIRYPCLRGDIEQTAGLTVYDPDDGTVHFAEWRPSIRMPFLALRSCRQRARKFCGWSELGASATPHLP
jgi:hypothetical protein